MVKFRRVATISLLALWAIIVIACTGTGSSNKDGGGNKDGKTEGKTEGKVGRSIGDEIAFKDSKWVVLDAKDQGKTLQSNNQFQKEAKTDGTFVVVHFKVTNLGKKEQRLISTPKLIDSQGREFKDYDHQSFYIPKDAKTMMMEALPASLTREFYHVFEVPADAKGLKFQVRDLSSVFTPDYQLVDLGF